jgi:RNA polymerase sigma factor (sigma-70 family)
VRRLGLPVDQLPDETLLAGFGNGDEELSLAFVRRFQHRVYGVALAVVGNQHQAEDVAQQSFERAFRHAGSYDTRRAPVSAWLTTITRNLAIDTVRLRRSLPIDPGELIVRVAGEADGPERRALADEAGDEMRAALRSLPAGQARAVVLAGIAGLSASQVAEAEQIPLGTAKTRIRTAMQRLRTILAEAADQAEAGGVQAPQRSGGVRDA